MVSEGILSNFSIELFSICCYFIHVNVIPSSVLFFDSRLPLCDRRFCACLTPPTKIIYFFVKRNAEFVNCLLHFREVLDTREVVKHTHTQHAKQKF